MRLASGLRTADVTLARLAAAARLLCECQKKGNSSIRRLAAAVGAFVWNLSPLRRPPTARRLARFIEERVPGLDDRLATIGFCRSFTDQSALKLFKKSSSSFC